MSAPYLPGWVNRFSVILEVSEARKDLEQRAEQLCSLAHDPEVPERAREEALQLSVQLRILAGRMDVAIERLELNAP